MTETEIKLGVDNIPAMLEKLHAVGFVARGSKQFEDNWLFDFPSQTLRNAGSLLRLRKSGGSCCLTFKGPSAPDVRYKVREEIESAVKDGDAVQSILRLLGMKEVFQYQKWRTEFEWPGHSDVLVVLDETPVGDFLEVEGDPEGIDRVALELGYSSKDYILKSYGALFFERSGDPINPPAKMLFDSSRGEGQDRKRVKL